MTTKVIIKKKEDKFQWTQTEDSLTIYFPVKNVTLKSIDVLYTSEFIKVNVTSVKYFAVIDFAQSVDYENPKNRIQLQDEGLEVYLMKAEKENWSEVQIRNLSKEELIKRREESLNRYYKREEEKFKEAQEKKIKMDKHSVDQQMKVEDFQRKQLKRKKEEQKQLVENELYQDLNQLEQMNQKLLDQKQSQEQYQKTYQKEQYKCNNQDNENNQHQINDNRKASEKTSTIPEFRTEKTYNYKDDKEKDIFGDDDIETVPSNFKRDQPASQQITKNQINQQQIVQDVEDENQEIVQEVEEEVVPVEVPVVREKQDVKVQFTEKKFPHLPARESHMKEAPYPKSKQIDKKKDDVYIDIEDKDPVWLKDKGDHFYNRNDYNSAINAYSKALEFDKDFMMGRLNRATTWLKVRMFHHCVSDCDDIENQIKALKESEREDPFYHKLLARLYVKRGAAYNWQSQFDKAIENFEKATQYKGIFSEAEIRELEKDIERIKKRQKSQLIKMEGDYKFAETDLETAFQMYHKALELDSRNEYAYANLGLIYLKRQEYEKCIEYSTKALDLIEQFLEDTKSFAKDNRLEVKILLRRGKSYENLGQFESAKADLDKAVALEPQNGEARTLLKKVQEKLDGILFDQYNKQAQEYQKQQQFANALEYYEKCLKITRKGTSLDNIAVYVNKIACLLSLEKHDRVVQECNDALRLIKNFKNRNEDKQTADEKKRLLQMEIRVSLRRGNALAKLNRVSEAIQEYERALKLDPQNETIQRDLDILRKGK